MRAAQSAGRVVAAVASPPATATGNAPPMHDSLSAHAGANAGAAGGAGAGPVGRLRRTQDHPRTKRAKARDASAAAAATSAGAPTPGLHEGLHEGLHDGLQTPPRAKGSAAPPSRSRFSSGGGWDLTAMRQAGQRLGDDPFWDGSTPTPLATLELGLVASPARTPAAGRGPGLLWEGAAAAHPPAPLTSAMSVLRAEAAAHAGPDGAAAASFAVDAAADTALERSRARAREAKARLAASSTPHAGVPVSATPGAMAAARPWQPKFDSSMVSYDNYFASLLVPYQQSSPSKALLR